MLIDSVRVQNYRRLRDVQFSTEGDTTIFVGANNSGKTSAAQIFRSFFGPGSSGFTFYDFSAATWSEFDAAGDSDELDVPLPSITLDIWFKVQKADLHRVMRIIPSLDWNDEPLGVRLKYCPRDQIELLRRYRELRDENKRALREEGAAEPADYMPWPSSLCDYLKKELRRTYQTEYLTLEPVGEGKEVEEGLVLGDSVQSGEAVLASLMRVDFLDAQRFLTDAESGGRSEDLSKKLSSFYRRNRERAELDLQARQELARSEKNFDSHLAAAFKSTLDSLKGLGYPGFAEPDIELRSNFNSDNVVARNANVHYKVVDDTAPSTGTHSLPDRYSGLGFKNLIYMVVELLDFHETWAAQELDRPVLHLIVIEEPEVHLHVQLQQVFIREVYRVIERRSPDLPPPQMIVTTHSPHVIYEGEYQRVRYFKRLGAGASISSTTEVLSPASAITAETADVVFLQRYLKLTHCDLFFADAVILIEGNTERLLLPLMISKAAAKLSARYISILEVGGAFAHKFTPIVRLLGIPALIITDIDSVCLPCRSSCRPEAEGAITSNATISRLLSKDNIDDLLELGDEDLELGPANGESPIRLAYQRAVYFEFNGTNTKLTGRTFEEAFMYENLAWSLAPSQLEHLQFYGASRPGEEATAEEMANYINIRVDKNLKKTEFALALMTADDSWRAPAYIDSGLKWLESALEGQQSQEVIDGK